MACPRWVVSRTCIDSGKAGEGTPQKLAIIGEDTECRIIPFADWLRSALSDLGLTVEIFTPSPEAEAGLQAGDDSLMRAENLDWLAKLESNTPILDIGPAGDVINGVDHPFYWEEYWTSVGWSNRLDLWGFWRI